jgi:MSHA biogenesis protein MshK
MRKRIYPVVALLLALPAAANSFTDPTRPIESAAPSRAGAPATSAPAPTGPVLQSTLISPYRKSAMISGQRVKVGDNFEGAVIVDITPYEVRMNRAGQETSLRLTPKLFTEKGKVE